MIRKVIATLLLVALPSLPAFAGKPDNPGNSGKNKGNSQKAQKSQGGGGGQGANKNGGDHGNNYNQGHYDDGHGDWRRFSSGDRDVWRGYWGEQYGRGNCPPGLAKKNNGCLPPGQAKKRYAVGHSLPPDFVILPVPDLILPRLAPLQPGYRYGMIDGDLVQLAVGSLLVVDAIEGLTD